MINQINKFNIKIPTDITVIYSKRERTLTLLGPLKRKSMKLKVKIFVDKPKKILSVSPLTFNQMSNTQRKKIKALRNTTVAQIKHMLIESSISVHKKLKINGVGYRAFFAEKFSEKLLSLKLGYSHFIYVKIPESLNVNCFTKTKLYVFGDSYDTVSNFSALIRAKKLPEPYKSKGVLYDDEIIVLKEGKKI